MAGCKQADGYSDVNELLPNNNTFTLTSLQYIAVIVIIYCTWLGMVPVKYGPEPKFHFLVNFL